MALTLTPTLLHVALPWKAKSVLKEEVSKRSKGFTLVFQIHSFALDPVWLGVPCQEGSDAFIMHSGTSLVCGGVSTEAVQRGAAAAGGFDHFC